MKKHRKLVALLIALTFLFSIAAPAFAATPSAQQKSADKLNVLGIIEGYPDGSFGLDQDITRAEFAKIAVAAAGLTEAAEQLVNYPSQFSDVKSGEWYTGWINMAASQGYVKGDPNGTYRPNDKINYAEVVTVLVRLLGYSDNLPGPWPTNYLAKAVELDITKGVSLNASVPAVRGDVFVMADNTLNTRTVRWSTENQAYENLKDKLIVKSFKGIMDEAIVTDITWDSKGDIYVDLVGNNGDKINNVKVVKSVIVSGAEDPYGLLGKQVEFIRNAKATGVDRHAIVFLGEKETDSVSHSKAIYEGRYIEVNNKRYDVAKDGFGVTYFPAGNSNTVGNSSQDFAGDKVEVVFNVDGEAQWVFVYDFSNPDVIKEVDGNRAFGDMRTRIEYDQKKIQVFVKDGVIASFEDLAEGDLVYVFDNDERNTDLLVFAVSEVKEGKLDEAEKSWKHVTVDGKRINVHGDYIASNDGGESFGSVGFEDALLGEEIQYMLSPAGKIAAVISGVASQKLVGVVEYVDTSSARGHEARILLPDGTKAFYYADSDFSKKAGGDWQTLLSNLGAPGLGQTPQLVEYSLNKAGRIDKIAFATDYDFLDKDGRRAQLKVGGVEEWYRVDNNAAFFGLDNNPNLVSTDWDTFKSYAKAGSPNTISVLMSRGTVKAMYVDSKIVDTDNRGVIAKVGRDAGRGQFYDMFVKGKTVRYNVTGNAATNMVPGQVVKFALSSGKIDSISEITSSGDGLAMTGVVTDRDSERFEVTDASNAKKYYYIDKDTMIVDITETTKKIVSSVVRGDNVKVFRDKKGIIEIVVIDNSKPSTPGVGQVTTDGTVTYISSNFGAENLVIVGDQEFEVTAGLQPLFGTVIVKGDKISYDVTKGGTIYAITVVDKAEASASTEDISGITFSGNLTITGALTASNVTVNGNLTVNAGANLAATNWHVKGTTTINGAATFNSELDGNVTVGATAGIVGFTNVEFGGNLAVAGGTVTVTNGSVAGNITRTAGTVNLAGKLTVTGTVDPAANTTGLDSENKAAIEANQKAVAAAAVKLNSASLILNNVASITGVVDGKTVTFTLDAQAADVKLTGITADFAGLKDGTYEINLMKVESADAIADAGFKAALEAAGFVINGDVATHATGQKFGDLAGSNSAITNLPADQTFQTKGTWTLKVEVNDAADQAHTFTILIVVK